ncbi:MAG: (2Fe-2S)-binding protein [Calditrichaceae bacterium]|nr:(2Fe-2S)-binding protein [Calditrichaceae bacterium]MBN2708498.1 (2Fe-2S)-binding protein [Calditrichaceae bacterium]RQV91968.1 MAG: (2Fe-2S)-binding protein [Calditrichota bacterium]
MEKIHLQINGRNYHLEVPATELLVDTLRERLGLTGTKKGCEIGECGACTVLIDDKAVNSCLILTAQAEGKKITTIEGVGDYNNLHPVQQAFLNHDAVHCGFCTPGMVLSVIGLLKRNPRPNEKEIREAIAGNLCRCTGYKQIVEAVLDVIGQGEKNI